MVSSAGLMRVATNEQISVSLHPRIRNKPDWQPSFGDDWQSRDLSLSELRDHVSAGGAFVPAAMSSPHRSSDAFLHADLAVVDIDHGLTIADFLHNPLAKEACWLYTTFTHRPDQHRFRIVFRLSERIASPELIKALSTALTRKLGGDRSCTDPCRLYYGNDKAEHPLWAPEATLSPEWIRNAQLELRSQAARRSSAPDQYDETTIEQAIWVLENVIPPTDDGERDRFIKVTAAASSAGEPLLGAWQVWAGACHHTTGHRSRQGSERYFHSFKGRSTLATLFFLASETNPEWRKDLPDHIRSRGGNHKKAPPGYEHEAFLGYDALDMGWDKYDLEKQIEHSERLESTPSVFDLPRLVAEGVIRMHPRPKPADSADAAPEPAAPAMQITHSPIAPIETPLPDGPPDDDDEGPISEEDSDEEYYDPLGEPPDGAFDDFDPGEPPDYLNDDDDPDAPPRRRGRPRRNGGQQEDPVDAIKTRLLALFPRMRLNVLTKQLEYGPLDAPQEVPDPSTLYLRISAGTGTIHQKGHVYDAAQIIGQTSQYNPAESYLKFCNETAEPCSYFKTLATELLGLSDDPLTNPVFQSGPEKGRTFADVMLERFLIGAVARIFEPGCVHDWMLILIGSQNSGKSTFFQYLTPPAPSDPGNYPLACTIQQGIAQIKEKPHILHAGWIVNFDECERYFKRRYVEELKNLVSVAIDRSARKYENESNFKRAFVLVGATNSNDFLVDPTGNRRFMPVNVTGKVSSPQDPAIKIIDLDRVKAERDSIWAAAYRAYQDNPVHTWSSYELSLMGDYLDSFVADSPLEARVRRILELRRSGVWQGYNFVTLSDLYEWLDIPVKEQASTCLQVTDALKRLGFTLKHVKIGGKKHRIWVEMRRAETPPD